MACEFHLLYHGGGPRGYLSEEDCPEGFYFRSRVTDCSRRGVFGLWGLSQPYETEQEAREAVAHLYPDAVEARS